MASECALIYFVLSFPTPIYLTFLLLLLALGSPLAFATSPLCRLLSQHPALSPRTLLKVTKLSQHRQHKRVMADNRITQQPEMEDVIMKDASILCLNETLLEAQETGFDPMDISTPSPRDQILRSSQKIHPVAEQNSLPWLGPSSLQQRSRTTGPLFSKSSLVPQIRVRFSPNSRSQSRSKPPSTGLILPRVADLRPFKKPTYNATGMTYYPGLLNRDRHPSYLSSTRASGFQSGNTSRDSSFSSFDTQKSTEDGKANSFDSLTSVSTVQSSFSRKRSIDNETHSDHADVGTAGTDSHPFSKYRRVSEDGTGIPSVNGEADKMDPIPTLLQSNFSSPPQSALKPPTPSTSLVSPFSTTNNGTPQMKNSNPNSDIPGCWPLTPSLTPYKTTESSHSQPGINAPTKGMMSGALLLPPNNSKVPNSPHDAASEDAKPLSTENDGLANIIPTQNIQQQPTPYWRSYCVSLYSSIQKVYAFRHDMAQTLATAVKGALAIVDSVQQHASDLFGYRRPFERRSSPATTHSPVRANLRTLSPEQQQRIKANQWRKDRGYPVIEEYPFPKLSFDSPQFSPAPGPISQAENDTQDGMQHDIHQSLEALASSTVEHAGKHASPLPQSVNFRALKEKPQGHKGSTSGVRKASRLDPVGLQLKRRMHLRTKGRDRERGRRERALLQALRTGNFDAFNEIRPTETSHRLGPFMAGPSQVKDLEDSKRASIPLKPKPRVHFSEPLVTELVDKTRPALVTELAPHLRPAAPKIEHPAAVEEPFVEQKENIPPGFVPKVEPAAEVSVHKVIEPVETPVDPWSHPVEFPLGKPVSAVSLFYPTSKPLPPGRIESTYAEEWRKIEEEEKLKQRPTRIRPEGPAVRPLPPKWNTRVEDAMRLPNGRQIATTLSGDPLTKKDLATSFTPMAWLNDEVINSYLALIIDYLRRANGNAGRHDKPKFHAFNSFFFSNLRDKGYDSVRRWATRAKIGGEALLNLDTVFVPVHNSAHWTLIVVKPSDRTIEHFDSLGSLSRRHIGIVKNWLRGELGARFVEEEWTVLPSVSPQQDNGSDCGVFLLSTAKAVAIDIEPLSYGAQDTRLLRKKIVAELMNGGLDGDFSPTDENGQVLL